MKNKLIFGFRVLFISGLLFMACDNGNNSDFTGTFRIRITGIPSDIMTARQNGRILIGIGPANVLQNNGLNALAGRNTNIFDNDDNFGTDWYEFFLYDIDNYQEKYTSSSGNYDIGFMNNSNDSTKIIRDIRLEVNITNTIGYSSFQ